MQHESQKTEITLSSEVIDAIVRGTAQESIRTGKYPSAHHLHKGVQVVTDAISRAFEDGHDAEEMAVTAAKAYKAGLAELGAKIYDPGQELEAILKQFRESGKGRWNE